MTERLDMRDKTMPGKLDLLDLALRIACANCGHSASEHNDAEDFCEDLDCSCLHFISLKSRDHAR